MFRCGWLSTKESDRERERGIETETRQDLPTACAREYGSDLPVLKREREREREEGKFLFAIALAKEKKEREREREGEREKA